MPEVAAAAPAAAADGLASRGKKKSPAQPIYLTEEEKQEQERLKKLEEMRLQEADRARRQQLIEKEALKAQKLFDKQQRARSEITLGRKRETIEAKNLLQKATSERVEKWRKMTANNPLSQTDMSWALDAYGERKPSRSALARQEERKRRMVHNAILYAGIAEPDDYMRNLIMEKRDLVTTAKATKAKMDLEKVNLRIAKATMNKDKFIEEMNSRPQLQFITSDYFSKSVLRERPGWSPHTRVHTLLAIEEQRREKAEAAREADLDEEEEKWRPVEDIFDQYCGENGMTLQGFEKILEQCKIIDGTASGVFTSGHAAVIWSNTDVAGRRKFIRFDSFKEACRLLAARFECDLDWVRDVITGKALEPTSP